MGLRRSAVRAAFACIVWAALSGCGGPARVGVENLHAVLWSQVASEHDAACLAAYRSAQIQLDAALLDPTWTAATEQTSDFANLSPAIVLDIDETVLDNSPYQARILRKGVTHNEADWTSWCEERAAAPLPGAVEFCKYAAGKGVAVFYVTNRKEGLAAASADNLRQVGFPMTETSVMPQVKDWDKGPRRAAIANTHRILLVCGDNLGDFVSVPADAGASDRSRITKQHAYRWGKQWIMLPNPMYGDWERCLAPRDASPGKRFETKMELLRNQ